MRRAAILLMAAIPAAACGDLNTPTGTSPIADDGTSLTADDATSAQKKGGNGDEDTSGYAITDLDKGSASAINGSDVVVGGSGESGSCCAVRWDPVGGSYVQTVLPPLAGDADYGAAYGINDSGQIAGASSDAADALPHAVIWEADGAVRRLGELPDHNMSQAFGINDLGQAVGNSHTDWDFTADKAVLWDTDGAVRALGELSGEARSQARDVNGAGWVVGISGDPSRAVLWKLDAEGTPIFDIHPAEADWAWVESVSEPDPATGQFSVAGNVRFADQTVAALWTVAPQTDGAPIVTVEYLEVASSAEGVNAAGQVAVNPAAVWTSASSLVEPLPDLDKRGCGSSVRRLNSAGTVVGTSRVFAKGSCTDHAVVWTRK